MTRIPLDVSRMLNDIHALELAIGTDPITAWRRREEAKAAWQRSLSGQMWALQFALAELLGRMADAIRPQITRRAVLLWLLALVVAIGLGGCRLNDLLNPGPPPEEEKCFATVTFTWWNDRGDTTVVHREGVRVECPPDSTGVAP